MNTQPRKGFRTPATPTKGEIQQENQTLAEKLSNEVSGLKAQVNFMGNMLQQIANATRQLGPELDALTSLETANIAGEGASIALGDHVIVDYIGVLVNEDGSTGVDADGLPQYQESLYGLKFAIRNLGAGSLIPGFEETLVGKTVGETVEINTQFPADYGAKDLAGKKVKFLAHVHRIYRAFQVSPVEAAMAVYIKAKTDIQKAKQAAEEAVKAQVVADQPAQESAPVSENNEPQS